MILTWPAWHPEQELKADHLLALEDYLLTRVLLADDGAWGVESLDDWRHCIQAEASGDGMCLAVKVRRVRGVTPGGNHVWLYSDADWLEAVVERVDQAGGFDLWILVNSRERGAPKLSLQPAWVPSGELGSPVYAYDKPDALYLGRYRVPSPFPEQGLEIVHHPVPRRLSGFGLAAGESWQAWVKPLRERLEAVSQDLASRPLATPRQVAAMAELSRLIFEWPVLTIPMLARRLQLIAWLREASEGPLTAPDPAIAASPFALAEITGDRLPQALADLIKLGRERTGDSGFYRLLRLLMSDGITYYAPLAALQEWAESLDPQGPGGLSDEQAAILREADAALAGGPRSLNPWARALALITVLLFENRKSGERKLPAQANAAELSAAELCSVLDRLLHGEAGEAPAGPLAFSWLARVAWRDPEIRRHASASLESYGRLLTFAAADSGEQPLRGLAGGTDRVVGFLSRATNPSPDLPEIRPYVWTPEISAVRAEPMVPGELRIALVGGPASGKSAVARALAGACRGITDGGVVDDGDSVLMGATREANPAETRCRLVLDGRATQLCLVGTPLISRPGVSPQSAESDKLLRTGSGSDLVVATLDPVSVARAKSSDASAFVDYWRQVLAQHPTARLAIAYTKADEYGVINEQAIRLISNAAHVKALQKFRAERTEMAWDQFASSAAGERSSVRVEGMASFSRNVKGTSEAEWAATRRWVLLQTRPLWEFALQQPAHFINGYFISAESRDPYLEPSGRAGALHMLADLIRWFKLGSGSFGGAKEPAGTMARALRQGLGRRELS
jgi:hypothetical protein